jgi:molecular chaperone GrpE
MRKPDTTNATPTASNPEAGPAEPSPASAGPGSQPPDTQAAATAGSSAKDIAALQAEAAKAREYHDKLLRTAADFDNYKKRMARERAEADRYAVQGLLQKLIPVLDNFDIALAAVQSATDPNPGALREGVQMVHQQFKSALAAAGLEEISALHQPFDPHLHEAVSQQESADVPEGHVVHQVRKGYKLRDRLLRPASVVVARAPVLADEAPAPTEESTVE